MLIKPWWIGGTLYGIYLVLIHHYKTKEQPKINIFIMNELKSEVIKLMEFYIVNVVV